MWPRQTRRLNRSFFNTKPIFFLHLIPFGFYLYLTSHLYPLKSSLAQRRREWNWSLLNIVLNDCLGKKTNEHEYTITKWKKCDLVGWFGSLCFFLFHFPADSHSLSLSLIRCLLLSLSFCVPFSPFEKWYIYSIRITHTLLCFMTTNDFRYMKNVLLAPSVHLYIKKMHFHIKWMRATTVLETVCCKTILFRHIFTKLNKYVTWFTKFHDFTMWRWMSTM